MNRSPRRKAQPKRFTPTQPSICSQKNYLLRFEDNGELIVVKRSSIKSLIEDKAVVGTGANCRIGIVEAKGSYTQCNAIHEQMTSDDVEVTNEQEDSLDQVNESEDDLFSDDNHHGQTQSTLYSPSTQKRKRSLLTADDNDEAFNDNLLASQQGLSLNKKPRRLFDQSLLNKNDTIANKNAEKIQSADSYVLYQTIDDMHQLILHKLEKKLETFSKKFDRLIPRSVDQNLDLYREKEEVFPPTVLYNGIDLLKTRGRDIYDFGRQTLRILFTSQELNECILPPGRKHLARPPLDTERFNLFHEAVRVKYRLSVLHYDSCYSKLIKPRMCDFLIDERKRQARNLL